MLATLICAPAHADRDRLRYIVQHECLPHWLEQADPAPCSNVTVVAPPPTAQGYAVLADRKGGAHYLLIPLYPIGGVESPLLHAGGALNYFDAAWQARAVLEGTLHHPLAREAVGLAVNQRAARSQDQLHIHISCLQPGLQRALHADAPRLQSRWAPLVIEGRSYQALRLMGERPGDADPFRLLAELPGAQAAMDEFTLLLAGMQFESGPGFALLAGRAVPGAELLLDADCALAR